MCVCVCLCVCVCVCVCACPHRIPLLQSGGCMLVIGGERVLMEAKKIDACFKASRAVIL